jgi:NDP-sugar pyrophosphorylase family protein
MSSITGAILAGGLGTRLRSVVSDRPKVLALVRGLPFLAYLLDQLGQAGIRRVVLLTGYKGEQIEQTFGSRYGNIELDYSAETEPLGTAGALRLALPRLFTGATGAGTVFMLNGDSFCAADLNGFRAFHTNLQRQRGTVASPVQNNGASIVLTRVPDTSRFGKVEVTADDRVERFVEKQEAGGAGWINAGIYLIPQELVEQIPAGRAVSIEREMFPAWSQKGKLRGFRGEGEFLDIGTPESYRAAEEFFARRAA